MIVMGARPFFWSAIFLFLVLASPFDVSAVMLGVNRASLEFSDVLRNGYAEQSFVVSVGSPQYVQVFYEARGDIAEWVRFEPEELPLLVNEDNPGTVTVIVEPPADTQVGVYEGIIFVSTGHLGEIQGQMGTNVVAAFEVRTTVEITDTQILRCTTGGMSLGDAEIGYPVEFTATARNTGNVRIRPGFEFTIYDQFQTEELETYEFAYSQDVLPTKTESIVGSLNLDLEPGQYWVDISEPVCGSSTLATFSVLERGGISDLGEFVRINHGAWAESGEIIPVDVQFRNRGERVVSAQFKGVVSKDGRIIQVLESDEIDVPAGELASFDLFFTPEEPGQYRISGRVHYNRKITFERGSILNVNPATGAVVGPSGMGFDGFSVLFFVIIIVIAGLLFLILRKKKN